MGGRYSNTLKGDQLRNGESYRSTVWAASAEAGYGVVINDGNPARRIILQPQAQVIGSHYRAGDHVENSTEMRVSDMNANMLTTRLGVRVYADDVTRNDGDLRLRPFGTVNWWHSPSSRAMNFAGVTVRDTLPANITEVKIGIEGNKNNKLVLNGWLGGQFGKGYSSVSINAGLKYAW
jgi:outer membrane autotransporter protein